MSDSEYAYFVVSGLGRHEEITQKLGVKPNEAWNVGELSPRGITRQQMSWHLYSGLSDSEPLVQHIDALVLFLSTRAGTLRELWQEYTLTLQCVGRYSSAHGLHLDRERVRRLANLGVAIDLDLYVVPTEGGA